MKKCRWTDPVMSGELTDIFMRYGKKFIAAKGDVLVSSAERNSFFHYVESGLLAATSGATPPCCRGIIVKLIPENRAFGFTDYKTAGTERYNLTALRDSAVYKLPYAVMDALINEGAIDSWSFRRYSSICRQATVNTFSTMLALPPDKRLLSLYAASMLNEFNGTGSGCGPLKLTPEDICGLMFANPYVRRKKNLRRLAMESVFGKEREMLTGIKNVIDCQ